ncbi:MAG: hypothetical protein QFF03_24410, partial [Pseudomonadota bacterium]|nr:hypothetical protein [Pseudomonadota bacterium]
HVDGHAPAYWPCTASRVRFAGQRFAQPALDPVPSRIASRLAMVMVTIKSGIHSGSRHGSRSQLPFKTALGLVWQQQVMVDANAEWHMENCANLCQMDVFRKIILRRFNWAQWRGQAIAPSASPNM